MFTSEHRYIHLNEQAAYRGDLILSAVLCLVFLLPSTSHGQLRINDDLYLSPQRDDLVFLARGDSLYRVDMKQGEALPFAAMPDASFFLSNTKPGPHASIISDSTLWMWDNGIGSTFSYELSGAMAAYPQYPSRTRYSHASTTRPDTGEPLVFGGYGYYRAKDFFIYFDTELQQWRELAYELGPHDPKGQIGSSLLNVGNGRDIYLVQGLTSKEVSPRYYDQQTEPLALVFDFDRRAWRNTRMNLEVACLISTHAKRKQVRFRDAGITFAGVLRPVTPACVRLIQEREDLSDMSLIFWQPEAGLWAIQPADTPLPSSMYIAGFQFDDSTATNILLDVGRLNGPSIDVRSYPISDSLVWQPLPKLERASIPWHWVWVGVFAVGLSFLFVWTVWFRRYVYLVADEDLLLIRRGSLLMRVSLVPNATLLLAYLMEQPSGAWLNRTHIETPFAAMAYAEDALRTTINRAISSINDIGISEIGEELIERRPSSSDKRKQEYRLNPGIRCKGRGLKRF